MVLDWGVHLLDQVNMMMGQNAGFRLRNAIQRNERRSGRRLYATFKFDNDLVFTVEVGTSNFINLPR